jgi:hypothetical protein
MRLKSQQVTHSLILDEMLMMLMLLQKCQLRMLFPSLSLFLSFSLTSLNLCMYVCMCVNSTGYSKHKQLKRSNKQILDIPCRSILIRPHEKKNNDREMKNKNENPTRDDDDLYVCLCVVAINKMMLPLFAHVVVGCTYSHMNNCS